MLRAGLIGPTGGYSRHAPFGPLTDCPAIL